MCVCVCACAMKRGMLCTSIRVHQTICCACDELNDACVYRIKSGVRVRVRVRVRVCTKRNESVCVSNIVSSYNSPNRLDSTYACAYYCCWGRVAAPTQPSEPLTEDCTQTVRHFGGSRTKK